MLGISLDMKESWTPFFYAAAFIIIMVRLNGISNLLRFTFRYLKIGYSDRKMTALDEQWFNIQLFKIINGINVSNLHDARIIQKGLNEAKLNPSSFLFTSSWGDITIAMPLKKKIFSYIVGFILFAVGCAAWHQQLKIVEGFAKFDYINSSFYVSKEQLIITSRDGNINHSIVHTKQDCIKGKKLLPENTIFSIACTKLLDDSDSYHWWLKNEISTVNNAKRVTTYLSYIYLGLGVLWTFSLFKFNSANKEVLQYKSSLGIS